MKIKVIIVAGVVLCAGLSAQAQSVYLIDFNNNTTPASAGWNVYAAPANVTGVMSDTSGSSSAGVTIGVSGTIYDSSGAGMYNAASAPSWVTKAAGDDFFWTEASTTIIRGQNSSFVVNYGGMAAGTTVALDVFASRNSTYVLTAYYEYSLDNGSTWSGLSVLDNTGAAATANGWDTKNTQNQVFNLVTDGYNSGRYMSTMDVTLTGSTLLLRLQEDPGSDYAGINAMRLTVVPEPASLALLTSASGLILCLRRKSHVG